MTHWQGLQSYRSVLQMDKVWAAIGSGNFGDILQNDFWKALRFTLLRRTWRDHKGGAH